MRSIAWGCDAEVCNIRSKYSDLSGPACQVSFVEKAMFNDLVSSALTH